jgi:HKD family nuclease
MIEYLVNTPISNLKSEIQERLNNCLSCNIATAFISEHAIDFIEKSLLNRSIKLQNIRLITGVYQGFNKKSDLYRLNLLAEKSKGRFEVRVSGDYKFHWKLYSFFEINMNSIYVGSANFTNKGLSETGELTVKYTSNKRDAFIKDIQSEFKREWDDGILIKDFAIDQYQENCLQFENYNKNINKLLIRTGHIVKDNGDMRVRTVKCTIALHSKTVKIISEFINEWDSNDWEYINCDGQRDFEQIRIGDYFLLLWPHKKAYKFQWVRVIDRRVIPVTPDGKYFIAYEEVSKVFDENDQIENLFASTFKNNYRGKFKEKQLGKNQIQKLLDVLPKM